MTAKDYFSPNESKMRSGDYLLPNVCFECRKVFRKPESENLWKCPNCAEEMAALNRKFSAPKSTDIKQWKKVKFLVEHGFLFHSIYKMKEKGVYYKVRYPKTLKEAEQFVNTYADQAIKRNT